MEQAQEIQELNAPAATGNYKWWLTVSLNTILVLVSQTGATLLGRFYFNNGGTSRWMATITQTAGFPLLTPLLLYFSPKPSNDTKGLPFWKVLLIYIFFGAVGCGDNLMYSYGTSYLPVSTYSLICATQLAFNALFSYFLNSLKFTAYMLNSLVLVTISVVVLGIQGESESPGPSNIPSGKHIAGFLCTIAASALYSLLLSLTQAFFEKIRKKQTFPVILEMTFFVGMVATSASIVGLFVSGDWRRLEGEMELFKTGRVSYIMTLVWTAVLWQVYFVSSFGLIHQASSLFSNMISTVCLPIVPLLAVIIFHDKMDGMKVVAMFLAFWGFVSYVYEHYLDYSESKTVRVNANGISSC